MPRLSCWFVRSALVWLAAGWTLGALLLAGKGWALPPWAWKLRALHVEALMFGWTAQLAMGVAFWILPRLGLGESRGDERPAWAAFALVNAGALAAGAGGLVSPAAVVAGRLLEAGAVVAFAIHAWPRLRSWEDILREASRTSAENHAR